MILHGMIMLLHIYFARISYLSIFRPQHVLFFQFQVADMFYFCLFMHIL